MTTTVHILGSSITMTENYVWDETGRRTRLADVRPKTLCGLPIASGMTRSERTINCGNCLRSRRYRRWVDDNPEVTP